MKLKNAQIGQIVQAKVDGADNLGKINRDELGLIIDIEYDIYTTYNLKVVWRGNLYLWTDIKKVRIAHEI